jgi:hypothetical protein
MYYWQRIKLLINPLSFFEKNSFDKTVTHDLPAAVLVKFNFNKRWFSIIALYVLV